MSLRLFVYSPFHLNGRCSCSVIWHTDDVLFCLMDVPVMVHSIYFVREFLFAAKMVIIWCSVLNQSDLFGVCSIRLVSFIASNVRKWANESTNYYF